MFLQHICVILEDLGYLFYLYKYAQFMQKHANKRPTFLTFIPGDNMDHLTWFSVTFLPIFWKLHFKIKNI